jgi:hypothetical protein
MNICMLMCVSSWIYFLSKLGEKVEKLIFDLHLESLHQNIYLIKHSESFYHNQLRHICIGNIMIEF